MNKCTDFEPLVEKALEKESLKRFQVKDCGGNEKGEGYIGDITFIDVYAEKNDGSEVIYNLVLKIGGRNKISRQIVRLGFEREIDVFSKVLPAFRRLEITHHANPFSSIPRCYLTVLNEHEEVLVLQNIKALGFKLHDRKETMNLNHINVVMRILGHWHALSLVLKTQRPKEFSELIENWQCPVTEMFANSHIAEWLNISQTYLFQVLEENDEDILKKYIEKIHNEKATDTIRRILESNEEHTVIIHGDCWNNNLMFKYKDNDEETPSEVELLDFQLSTVSSPVIDLSYFIYAVSSEIELNHFEELLRTYYSSLSEHVKKLNCEPDVLFPYSRLKTHWTKYAAYGALIQPLIVCDALVDKDDAASYGNQNENYRFVIKSVEEKHNEAFKSRLIATARHFTTFEF